MSGAWIVRVRIDEKCIYLVVDILAEKVNEGF